MRRALAVFSLTALACTGPDIPARQPAYPFDDPGTGDVFHWPRGYNPVRFWVDPRGALTRRTEEGLDKWRAQFLYGEFSGTIVSDSLDADVLVTWGSNVPADVPPDTGPPVNACNGLTTFSVDSTNTVDDYWRVEVNVPASAATPEQIAACVVRVTLHEIGHALGLIGLHSADTADIMYAFPRVTTPSDGDRRTVEVLYHTAPTIAPRPRP